MSANSLKREGELQGKFDQIKTKYLEETNFKRQDKGVDVGLELELFIVNSPDLEPVGYLERDCLVQQLISNSHSFVKEELGGSQVEIVTEHINISRDGITRLVEHVNKLEGFLVESCVHKGYQLFRSGSHLLVDPANYQRTENVEKYLTVPDFHNVNRKRDDQCNPILFGRNEKKVDITDAAILGLCSAIQATIDAHSFDDALDKLNRSLMISPFAVALFANARYLGGVDTGFEDFRFHIWELNHDTRTQEEVEVGKPTRVGLPKDYHQNMESYIHDLRAYPFILDTDFGEKPEDAKVQEFLNKTVGLNWRDARIKFVVDEKPNKLLVEFRPVSTQSTLKEDLAAVMFYIGRLAWSQKHNEKLIPMRLVRLNKKQAMLNGSSCKLWYRDSNGKILEGEAKEVLRFEINRAIEGLVLINSAHGDSQEIRLYQEIMYNNLGHSPSCRLAGTIKKLLDAHSEMSLQQAIVLACKNLGFLQLPSGNKVSI